MAITPGEKRFLRSWEEQRKDGKASFVGVYSFGLFILFSLACVAIGLFSGIPFLKASTLITMVVSSLVGGIGLSFFLWYYQERKFMGIIRRELEAARIADASQGPGNGEQDVDSSGLSD